MSKILLLFKSFIDLDCINKNERSKSNLGFSLIELSIVLIIMGILIIGVIRGYALMTASRIITLTNELTQYSFAAEQFSAKYGNLPGIIDNPQKILGNTAKSKIDEDKIDRLAINESASVTNAESINFFNHLYLSGLLGESSAPFVGTNTDLNNKNEITKDSNYYPTLQSIKSMFIYVRGDDVNGNYNKTNRLSVSSYTNDKLGINADLIFGLDNKVDDGLPLSGLISIIPMKVSNYGSSDKSSSYNNRNNNTQIVFINNVIDYYLSSSKPISSFNIVNIANAESNIIGDNNINKNESNFEEESIAGEAIPEPEPTPSLPSTSPSISSSSVNSCLILDKSSNEIIYNTKGKNCFILKNIDSTQQNKITDLAIKDTIGESCNLLNKDNYPNAESVVGITMLNGSKKTIKCNDGYTGNITITCNEGHPIHSGDAQCTFTGCKKYDNNTINSSLNAILTTNDIVNWDNVNEEDKNNLSNDDGVTYNKGDVIATLSCKEKDGYNLKEGSDGYTIKCDGNDNVITNSDGGCEYDVKTCSVKDLKSDILGENVKSIYWCADHNCENINSSKENSVLDITLEENKNITYNYSTVIAIYTCDTGYSAPENKRMIRCNEDGEWGVYKDTGNNMCTFTGCNDTSAVFDKNGQRVSERLYDMTLGSDERELKCIYTITYCRNNKSTTIQLNGEGNFVVNVNDIAICGDNEGVVKNEDLNTDRHYTCTPDTANINSGKSYWQTETASCDLDTIRTLVKEGNTIQLKTDLEKVFLSSKINQYRYLSSTSHNLNRFYTGQINNFSLVCSSDGEWVIERTNNTCQGLPVIEEAMGGKFYPNDENIMYVNDQSGMLINTSTLSKETSIKVQDAGEYFAIIGTKIEAYCEDKYQEVDQNGVPNYDSNVDKGGYYYECVKNNNENEAKWVARGGCEIRTCSIKKLTTNTNILGNDFVKTITQCNDESCSTTNTNEIIDITTEEGKSKIFDYNTYITINTCDTGYSTSNKRIIRCNENGEWEVIEKTKGNMCIFTGCNDTSVVFDKNGQRVSDQLYNMTFGSDNTLNTVYPLLYCHNNNLSDNSYTELSKSNNFIVEASNGNNIATVTCAETINSALDTTNENRHYTCTLDTENINEGKSYWKTKTASCNLDTIKNITNKGYTAYLSNTYSTTLVTLNNKGTQHRYLSTTYWSRLYTDQTSNFTLSCNSNGNWVMEKTDNSCQGLPTKVTGSEFWASDTDIRYVGESGMLMNKSKLSKDTSTLTKDMLSSETGTYFVTNGTKIEASCNSGYQEVDKNNIPNYDSSVDYGGHYYECTNGSWVARGGCVEQ